MNWLDRNIDRVLGFMGVLNVGMGLLNAFVGNSGAAMFNLTIGVFCFGQYIIAAGNKKPPGGG